MKQIVWLLLCGVVVLGGGMFPVQAADIMDFENMWGDGGDYSSIFDQYQSDYGMVFSILPDPSKAIAVPGMPTFEELDNDDPMSDFTDDWMIDVELPTDVVEPGNFYDLDEALTGLPMIEDIEQGGMPQIEADFIGAETQGLELALDSVSPGLTTPVVPEPASVGLLGLFCMALMRRKYNTKL